MEQLSLLLNLQNFKTWDALENYYASDLYCSTSTAQRGGRGSLFKNLIKLPSVSQQEPENVHLWTAKLPSHYSEAHFTFVLHHLHRLFCCVDVIPSLVIITHITLRESHLKTWHHLHWTPKPRLPLRLIKAVLFCFPTPDKGLALTQTVHHRSRGPCVKPDPAPNL